MADRKDLLKKAKMPIGKQAKQKLDEWINQNINLPLAKRGHENTGAAISAALSAGGEMLIPDDLADAAMAAIPGARLAQVAKKGMKALKKAPELNYKEIEAAEAAKRAAKRDKYDKEANTIIHEDGGKTIKVKEPEDATDVQLRARERIKQRQKERRGR